MLRFLKIWSGVAALAFIAGETLTASPDKPLPVLLPYYIIAAWLLAGLLFRRAGPALLLSGWAVAFGYSYVAFADLLTIFMPPTFLLVLVGVSAGGSLVSLLLAKYCFTVCPEASSATGERDGRSSRVLNMGSGLLAGVVILGQVFTSWGEGRHGIVLVAYYLIAGGLAAAVFFHTAGLRWLLPIWGVALGFFYAEFSGFLVFFDRPAWVLGLSGAVAGVSLLGVALAIREIPLCARQP